MESMIGEGFTLFFNPEDRTTAEIAFTACVKSRQLIEDYWGLDAPRRCRVFIMTSWLRFVVLGTPFVWLVFHTALFPLVLLQHRLRWSQARGLALPYKNNPSIGIKPPRLLKVGDRSVGSKIYRRDESAKAAIEHVVCHEMMDAYCASVRLPMWLNEGIAIVTQERFLGTQSVRLDSLESLRYSKHRKEPESYRHSLQLKPDAFAHQYIRGYWITRFLDETRPELLRRLLKGRRLEWEVKKEIAEEMGMDRHRFWSEIDKIVIDHFSTASSETLACDPPPTPS